MITLQGAPAIFVDESVEEIHRRLTAEWQPVKAGDGVSNFGAPKTVRP